MSSIVVFKTEDVNVLSVTLALKTFVPHLLLSPAGSPLKSHAWPHSVLQISSLRSVQFPFLYKLFKYLHTPEIKWYNVFATRDLNFQAMGGWSTTPTACVVNSQSGRSVKVPNFFFPRFRKVPETCSDVVVVKILNEIKQFWLKKCKTGVRKLLK